MKSIEELKRENARLISQREVREDFKARNRERTKLLRDNRILRHERKIIFAKKVGAGIGAGARVFGTGLKRLVGTPQRRRR